MTLDTMDRARWELAAMAGRLRSLEARLVEERRLAEAYRKERDRERKRADRLELGPLSWRAALRWWHGRNRAGARPPAGPGYAPVAAVRPPVHLYVVLGLDAAGVHDFVLTLRQRLLVSPDHRPVVMTDCVSYPAGDHGVLLEYLPDRATWERHRPDRSWEDVLSERLTRLSRDHDTVRTTIVDRARPPTLAELLR
ncbi:hypothetical protein ACGFJ7_02270 [Actinoplanes sp. NPDC048988]|uniref:hypothetical protein n=1 Tax=Actinoplanes sp. NPDC048988 TaxID=3363901 RepID=UPI003710AB5A